MDRSKKKNVYNLYQPKLQKSGSGLRRSSSWRKFKDTVRDTVTGMVQKTVHVKSGSVGGSGDTVNLMSSLDNEEVEDLAPEVPPPQPSGLATSSFFSLFACMNDLPSKQINDPSSGGILSSFIRPCYSLVLVSDPVSALELAYCSASRDS